MCGICGFVSQDTEETLARMNDTLAHRGPDDSGTYLSAPLSDGCRVGLGSRRLAILDLSPAGHMPMSNPEKTLWIVYNGEVYKYPQIRQELEAKGYRFRSRSDTEAVLYLYQEYGVNCVRCLNGMFALAIWDVARKQLFMARDHFGIKPLYYFNQNGRFAFASEIKSMLALPDFPRRMSPAALSQYLNFLWVPDPLTMFEGIYKLPAGHYAVFQEGKLSISEYWDLTFPPADHHFDSDENALTGELRDRFMRSVKAQLLSDVPMGAFLSAGLDSSSIVASMARACSEPVRTYTITFPPRYRRGEITMDDASVAKRTAAHFGCRHTEIMVEPKVVELLPKLIWHMDEPVADPAIITAYLVNHEARSTATVLLSGVGGDELFAGYRKYQAHFMAERYRRLPNWLRQRVLEPLVLALPVFRGTRIKGLVRLAKKMARSCSLPPEDRFLMDCTYLNAKQKSSLLREDVCWQISAPDPWQTHRRYFQSVNNADFLNQMLYLDIKTFLASLNLTYNDKMSMASSMEVRVPFLDHELAEWVAWNVPPDLKLRGGTTKYILRRAMAPVLPSEVLKQQKSGFGAPVDYWLANEMREIVNDLLGEERLRQRGLFDPVAVRRIIDEQRRGRQDWSLQIWQLLTLELWQQTFIDSKSIFVQKA